MMTSSIRSRRHQLAPWPVSRRSMVPRAPTMSPIWAGSRTADVGSAGMVAAARAPTGGLLRPRGLDENNDMVLPFENAQPEVHGAGIEGGVRRE
jgi:hypothetical protein